MDSLSSPEGTKCCITCKNLFNRVTGELPEGAYTTKESDIAKFEHYTNDEVYASYDRICAAPEDERKNLQQLLGLKIDANDLFSNAHLRTIWKPVDHTLRDPMHVFLNNGVVNSEIAHLARALKLHGITIGHMTEFMMTFTLPKRHGTVSDTWLSRKRFGKKFESLSSFSSILLSVLPIIVCFLSKVVDEHHPLYANLLCLKLLRNIIGIIMMGPTDAMPYVDKLAELLKNHAELFTELYPSAVKPKFHHALHIPENMRYLGKLLTCFVTERKHRATKRAALFIFRHIDNTVTKDICNRQCVAFSGDNSLFKRQYMHAPKQLTVHGFALKESKIAVLEYGAVQRNDIVYITTDDVCEVIDFWQHADDGVIVVRLRVLEQRGHDIWSRTSNIERIANVSSIIEAVMWAPSGDNIMIIPPFRVSLRS